MFRNFRGAPVCAFATPSSPSPTISAVTRLAPPEGTALLAGDRLVVILVLIQQLEVLVKGKMRGIWGRATSHAHRSHFGDPRAQPCGLEIEDYKECCRQAMWTGKQKNKGARLRAPERSSEVRPPGGLQRSTVAILLPHRCAGNSTMVTN